MIVFQGSEGLKNPHHVLNYTSTCNSAGRSITRMDRKPFSDWIYKRSVSYIMQPI